MKQELKFNRSKFRDGTSSEALKAADKSVENVIRTGQKGHYAGFLTLENGVNRFLLMPSHESIKQMMSETDDIKNEPFVVSKQIYWLPREVEEKDEKGVVKKDKKGNAIKKTINMPVFDARIHSEVKKDIVDIYIEMYKAQLEEEHPGKEVEDIVKEKMLIVYGSYQKKIQGIVGKSSWIMYAEKLVGDTKTFGRLEIGKAVKMRINELIAIEEATQPIGSESNNPFTDIEVRRAITIKYNSEANDAKLYYITEIDSQIDKDPKSPTYKQVATYPLSDMQLEEFLKFPSLSSLYKNCYTQKDFDMAMEGLQLFDDKHELGLFANQDFLDEAEHLRKLFPEPKEEAAAESAEEASEETGDKFDSMDREDMKKFSRENKTGIAIHSKLLDDDLRTQLKDWDKQHNGEETASEDAMASLGEPSDIEKAAKLKGSDNLSAKERIANARKTANGKK